MTNYFPVGTTLPYGINYASLPTGSYGAMGAPMGTGMVGSGYANAQGSPAPLSAYTCREKDDTGIKIAALGTLAILIGALLFKKNGNKLFKAVKGKEKVLENIKPENITPKKITAENIKYKKYRTIRDKSTVKTEPVIPEVKETVAINPEIITPKPASPRANSQKVNVQTISLNPNEATVKAETTAESKEILALPPHITAEQRVAENIARNIAKNEKINNDGMALTLPINSEKFTKESAKNFMDNYNNQQGGNYWTHTAEKIRLEKAKLAETPVVKPAETPATATFQINPDIEAKLQNSPLFKELDYFRKYAKDNKLSKAAVDDYCNKVKIDSSQLKSDLTPDELDYALSLIKNSV